MPEKQEKLRNPLHCVAIGCLAFQCHEQETAPVPEPWRRVQGRDGGEHGAANRARASTFGPSDEALTEADIVALAALQACLEREPIGVLLLEAWRFPGGGCWLTPAVYQRVRAICTCLGVAIVMDEAGSACRTGRFFAHEWLLCGGAPAGDMRPDALV